MSIMWFLILCGCYGIGIKIPDTAWIVLSVFYVGDCISWKGNK